MINVIEKAFPFKLSFSYNFFWVALEENKVIETWMVENMVGQWDFYYIDAGGSVGARMPGTYDCVMDPVVLVSIQLESDATLFSLRWL